ADSKAQTFETINLSMETAPEAPAAPAKPAMSFPTQPQAPQKTSSMPREALLAKARAYRESQLHRDANPPEQLSMNMDDAVPTRLTPETNRSPFENDSLEVPSYLRRKRGLGADNSEGIE